jgi:hypothetical protein
MSHVESQGVVFWSLLVNQRDFVVAVFLDQMWAPVVQEYEVGFPKARVFWGEVQQLHLILAVVSSLSPTLD